MKLELRGITKRFGSLTANDQIDLVVITHCHGDHIGGLMTDGKPSFSKARYAIGETEYQFWSAPERMSGATEGAAKAVAANVTPLTEMILARAAGTLPSDLFANFGAGDVVSGETLTQASTDILAALFEAGGGVGVRA